MASPGYLSWASGQAGKPYPAGVGGPDMRYLKIKLAIWILKALVYAYDFATLPIYFILQRPWEKWYLRSTQWAAPVQDADSSGPYIKTVQSERRNPVEGFDTVDRLFQEVTDLNSSRPLLGFREVLGEEDELQSNMKVLRKLRLGNYRWLTGQEVGDRVAVLSRGLLAIGVQPYQKVAIFAETRLEWLLMAQACFRINISVVTVYPTLGEDGAAFGIGETEAHCIVTSHTLLPKVQNIISRLPHVTHIIYMDWIHQPVLGGFPTSIKLMAFSAVESAGEVYKPDFEVLRPVPSDIAIIMYTSGSTGVPKGVLITHNNITKAVSALFTPLAAYGEPGNVYIAYLPLSHVLEMVSELVAFALGMQIGYSSPLTMTNKSTGLVKGCPGDATLLRPTIMTAVPLVLDRVRKNVLEVAESNGEFAKCVLQFAVSYKQLWVERGFGTPIMDWLIFKKISSLLGGRVTTIVAGGAKLSCDTQSFIRTCCCCNVIAGFGLTETTSTATVMNVEDESLGNVGPPAAGNTLIKLESWEEGGYHTTDYPYPRGEILVGGDVVTAGYYNNEALTREFYKEEKGIRWFYTGDIGEILPTGSVRVIDRKKDLVKLQNGEYIPVGKVEMELKTCPMVDNVCVVGNHVKNYLIALVVPNRQNLGKLAKDLGKDCLAFEGLCRDNVISSICTRNIQEHAKQCQLPKTYIPLKVRLCTEEWLPENGMTTVSFKIRRRAVEDFYRKDIDRMFATEAY